MRLSYIIAVLDSHEVVRRQLLHWKRMDLPDDIEIIIVDDGSDPPLEAPDPPRNLNLYQTHDKRPWTVSAAKNLGVRMAKADYVLNTDIDHILLRDALMDARAFEGYRMTFIREFGVLDENGSFTQDVPTLLSYGLQPERIQRKGLRAPAHGNSYVMRKDIFWKAGGYGLGDQGKHPPMDETHFRTAFRELHLPTSEYRPTIYLIPNGQYCGDLDYNPFNLFHKLSRKDWPIAKRKASRASLSR